MIENSYASSDITAEETKMFKPIAFQIRYKGCKGMVVEYPKPGRRIEIRPSMKKFECTTSKSLEIVKTSSPSLFALFNLSIYDHYVFVYIINKQPIKFSFQ